MAGNRIAWLHRRDQSERNLRIIFPADHPEPSTEVLSALRRQARDNPQRAIRQPQRKTAVGLLEHAIQRRTAMHAGDLERLNDETRIRIERSANQHVASIHAGQGTRFSAYHAIPHAIGVNELNEAVRSGTRHADSAGNDCR